MEWKIAGMEQVLYRLPSHFASTEQAGAEKPAKFFKTVAQRAIFCHYWDMKNFKVSKNPVWRRAVSTAAAAAMAPRSPGVYAYAEAPRVHELPSQLDWIYVGKASRLDRRLQQHDVGTERHPGLRNWLHRGKDREVWFAVIPNEDLDRVERDLISSLQPRLNRVRYVNHEANLNNES